MACQGQLTPLMMIAGNGLLENVGLDVNSGLSGAISDFNSLGITKTFSDIVSSATGLLDTGVLDSLRTMGADVFPALTNALPGLDLVGADIYSAISSIGDGIGQAAGGFTGLINNTANAIMGSGDLSIFGQIYNTASGYLGAANQFINSNLNIGSLAETFGSLTGGMDSLITGGFNQISESFSQFGSDLASLGNLVNLGNLPNLGNPAALVSQLASVGGLVPSVESALREVGLSSANLIQLASGQFSGITDSANKLLYDTMTKITGTDLDQVKAVLGVTTGNISSMADLLNPQKLFPNSYQTLTTFTPDGLLATYMPTGGVNFNLEKFFIDPNAPEYTGDDPIVRARLGLAPINADGNLTA